MFAHLALAVARAPQYRSLRGGESRIARDLDYEFVIPDELRALTRFCFDKYIRNTAMSPVYGDCNDFKRMLERNHLLVVDHASNQD